MCLPKILQPKTVQPNQRPTDPRSARRIKNPSQMFPRNRKLTSRKIRKEKTGTQKRRPMLMLQQKTNKVMLRNLVTNKTLI